MRNSISYMIALLFIVLCSSCEDVKPEFAFTGRWQSLNNEPVVIEFTKEGEFILFRDNRSLWKDATQNGELSIQLIPVESNWYHFQGLDGEEIFIQGKIETISDKRIRMYYLKSNGILDVADEYYRKTGNQSFSQIMDAIDAESKGKI